MIKLKIEIEAEDSGELEMVLFSLKKLGMNTVAYCPNPVNKETEKKGSSELTYGASSL